MTTAPPLRTPRPSRRDRVSQAGSVLADLPLFLTAPLYRPWHLRWGATPAEVVAALPGDDLLPRAQFRCTRAITVHAPPALVWPWLVQVGCHRAEAPARDLHVGGGDPGHGTQVTPAPDP